MGKKYVHIYSYPLNNPVVYEFNLGYFILEVYEKIKKEN